MKRRKLLARVLPVHIAVVTVVVAIIGGLTIRSLNKMYIRQVHHNLKSWIYLVQSIAVNCPASLDSLALTFSPIKDLRVTFIDRNGTILGDSRELISHMENHANRPEVIAAIRDGSGSATRASPTFDGAILMYYAVAPADTNKPIIRVAMPMQAIGKVMSEFYPVFFAAAGGILILIIILSWNLAREVSRPLYDMQQAAERFARGDYTARAPSDYAAEPALVSEAMNTMASNLEERIATITAQKNQLEAILSAMIEGMIAMDSDERLVSANSAACRIFGIDKNTSIGKLFQETFRNADLQLFITKVRAAQNTLEDEIYDNDRQRILTVRGTPLPDATGEKVGILLVVSDVTRLRRLETVRRDFVANVSHELRTPLTSVKGYVETLSDGKIDSTSETTRIFEIINRQVDRMNAIIDDLLALAKLEQEGSSGIEKNDTPLITVLNSAVANCSSKAIAKNITLEVESAENLTANINAPLLEQAVTNLIDNAVNYSPPNSRVRIEARLDKNLNGVHNSHRITIEVIDSGIGIEAQHLPRLFERFYRVDRSRSRKEGGTGLGLAIVKHIALAHNGSVSADSIYGVGSRFRIHLPV